MLFVQLSGPHGVGKTSIAEFLCRRRGYRLVSEAERAIPEELKLGVPGIEGFRSEIWFLVQLALRESRLRELEKTQGMCIWDRGLLDILAYTHVLTSDEHYRLIRTLADRLRLTKPHLVIYLTAKPETILKRLLGKGVREDMRYIEKLLDAFRIEFGAWSGDKAVLDTDGLGLEEAADRLGSLIDDWLKRRLGG